MGSCVSVNVFGEEGWGDLHSMSLVHPFELGREGKGKEMKAGMERGLTGGK